MPPKKKKTQLKKVERGFATTSIPKKLEKIDVQEEDVDALKRNDINETASSVGQSHGAETATDPKSQELQNLVDSLQEKTEKEVARIIKGIEYDRRMSKTCPSMTLDEALQEEIIGLARVHGLLSENVTNVEIGSKDLQLSRAGVVYGVLMKLNFDEDLVLDCLRSIHSVDLVSAADWLYLHCDEELLKFDKRSSLSEVESTSHTPKSVESCSAPRTPRVALQKLSSNASITPSRSRSSQVTSRTSVSPAKTFLAEVDHQDSDSDEDLTEKFVKLKLCLDEVSDGRAAQELELNARAVKSLQERLAKITNDYLFDKHEAEEAYLRAKKERNATLILLRLQGHRRTDSANSGRAVLNLVPDSADVFENEEANFFELLEPMSSEEVNSQGTTIAIRDMSLPKNWSGRTPKIALHDFAVRNDKFSAISYSIISGASRAKRASVTVRWTGGKLNCWSMDDIACYDSGQAEQYVATIALFSLTYPSQSGFQEIAKSSGNTSYRQFPPAFRELWTELEEKRKTELETKNREIWATLSSILGDRTKEEHLMKPFDRRQKDTIKDQISPAKTRKVVSPSADETFEEFCQLQANPYYQAMLMQRNCLPIAAYRFDIVNLLDMSQVVILSGETGCGKSTQLPSFILEDHMSKGQHCKILVTEPRRISAISLAQRVSRELGEPPGAVGTSSSMIGYSIRLENRVSNSTKLTFVTNGIALRMLEEGSAHSTTGSAFDEVTHIIVDEVHERSIESDFLLIVLRSLLERRKDLKVILMSATLDAEKFSAYFGQCPIIQVPGRTFPVDVRYLEDAVELTRWSISESSPYARRVFSSRFKRPNQEWSEDQAREEDEDEQNPSQTALKPSQRYSPSTISTMNLIDEYQIPYELIVKLLESVCFGSVEWAQYSGAFLIFMPGMGEIRKLNDILSEHPRFGSQLEFVLYPLHSMIPAESQGAVFEIPGPGIRKIVIATNIAETGITIPDITCVIDTGKQREMRFDEKRQLSRLVETFVARSNAAQRRGRAGRVQSGLCFHLFSKARQEMMADHPLPEMMRLSLSDLALRIKILNIYSGLTIEQVLSRALDPPSAVNIQRAVSALIEVQALTATEEITPMGRLLSKLPTDVHLGKFLLMAATFRCLDPALTIAATLNSKSPFVTPFGLEQEADRAKSGFKLGNSDFLTLHNAFASWRRASSNHGFIQTFCRQNFLSNQTLQQIEELRQQFLGYLVDSSFITVSTDFVHELNRVRFSRNRSRFVLVPGEYDRSSTDSLTLVNAMLCAGLYPKLLTIDTSGVGQLRTLTNNQVVYFHPSSVNFGRKLSEFGVNYLTYFTIMHSKKLYAWETGPVDDLAIFLLCGECEFKLFSDTAVTDRRLRYRLSPKANIALKILRSQLVKNLALQFKGKALTEKQSQWQELAIRVLGRWKSPDGNIQQIL